MTQRLLRGSILERQEQVGRLQRSLAEVREAVGKERELLHEVGATLAGITSASRVMRHGQAVPAPRRQRLESMLDAELDRLERLMHARVSGATALADCEIDLDEVVEPLVTSHHARGRDVRWFASGERAFGDPDELAEVVNILLENAGRHGGRGVVRLSVTAADGGALVICSDSGPGVPPELSDHLFEPEVRGAGIEGSGPRPGHRAPTRVRARREHRARRRPSARRDLRRPPSEKETLSMPSATSRSQFRIVIVEDHVLFAESLELALTVEGYDVRRVAVPEKRQSPGALIATVLRRRPRVVFVDLDLGQFGDGEQLIAPLARAGINVIVVTASVDRARWGEAVRCGARKVLPKSRPLNEILATVRRINQGLQVMTLEEREDLLREWAKERAANVDLQRAPRDR